MTYVIINLEAYKIKRKSLIKTILFKLEKFLSLVKKNICSKNQKEIRHFFLIHYRVFFEVFSCISDILGSKIIEPASGYLSHSYSGVSKNAVSL
jgi:hypothetical protein